MHRSAACRVIVINKKPILMTDLIIHIISKQAKDKKPGIEFSDINKNTTVNDYKEHGNGSDSDFENDDKSYKTSADSTLDGNNKIPDDPDQPDEYQQQHFIVLEVNDINKDVSNSRNEGVGDEGFSEEGNQIQDDGNNGDAGSTVHKIKEEDGTKEDKKSTEDNDVCIETVDNKDKSGGNGKPQAEPEDLAPLRIPAV